jgi:hypothetical protein
MSRTIAMPEASAEAIAFALRPEYYRLPKPGSSDPYYGFSRAFYYTAEKRGWLKLVRIRGEGKSRGVTLINYADELHSLGSNGRRKNDSQARLDSSASVLRASHADEEISRDRTAALEA